MQCSDGNEGRDKPQPTGLKDRVKGGQNCLPILCRKNLKAPPIGFLGMAPLRLVGGSVIALLQPQQKPSGLLCSPVIGNRDRGSTGRAAISGTEIGPPHGGPSSGRIYSWGSFELGGNITSS